MVALQILVLTVGVRILLGELKLTRQKLSAFLIAYKAASSNIGLVRHPLKVERRVRLP